MDLDANGHIRQGAHRQQDRTRHGAATLARTIRRAHTQRRRLIRPTAWLHIDLGPYVVLNADTKRAAVEAFLRDSGDNPERRWRVIANAQGRINKVLPYLETDVAPGWYASLTRPLARPGRI
jgi:hypothetical protein